MSTGTPIPVGTARNPGVGLVHEMIIRAIHSGKTQQGALHAALKSHVSGKTLDNVLAGMQRSGMIVRTRYGWQLTTRGRETLPTVQPAFARGVYTPPAPSYRRPGSDWTVFPSVAAGVEHPYKRHT